MTALRAESKVREATYADRRVRQTLDRGIGSSSSDALGRPGDLVMAERHVFSVRQTAHVTIDSVLWLRVADVSRTRICKQETGGAGNSATPQPGAGGRYVRAVEDPRRRSAGP